MNRYMTLLDYLSLSVLAVTTLVALTTISAHAYSNYPFIQ